MNIVICLPGQNYSGNFIKNWTSFIGECYKNDINLFISQHYSPNIYYVRNLCLGGNIKKGRNQKPFDGKINYDYILWIDSDNLPSFQGLIKLLNNNKDICAGIYKMKDGRYAVVEKWDTTELEKNGEMKFLSDEDLQLKKGLIKVSYTGMGFMLVKNGVLEKMTYPWFSPLQIDLGNLKDFTTEDVNFCIKAQELGFDIFIDPAVVIGHEKQYII